jgi:hypothetical protein
VLLEALETCATITGTGAVVAAFNAGLRALAAGEITPDEAVKLGRFLETRLKALQAVQLERRLTWYHDSDPIPGDGKEGVSGVDEAAAPGFPALEDEDEDEASANALSPHRQGDRGVGGGAGRGDDRPAPACAAAAPEGETARSAMAHARCRDGEVSAMAESGPRPAEAPSQGRHARGAALPRLTRQPGPQPGSTNLARAGEEGGKGLGPLGAFAVPGGEILRSHLHSACILPPRIPLSMRLRATTAPALPVSPR